MQLNNNKKLQLSRPARISLGYLAVATVWIVTSDGLIAFLASDPYTYTKLQTWKGSAFVVVTSLALYALLRAAPFHGEPAQRETAAAPHRAVLLGLTFLMLAATIIGFGTLAYRHQADTFKAQQYQQQAAIARLKAGQIERWVDWHRQDAELLRSDPDLIEAARLLSRGAAEKDALHMSMHFEGLLGTGRWAGIGLYAPDGRPLLLTGSADVADAGHRQTIAAALADGKVRLYDLHAADKPELSFHIDFLVPIYAGPGGGPPLGVVILSADPRKTLFEMVQTWPVPSASSETLLVRRDGDDILYLSPLRHSDQRPLSLRRPLDDGSRISSQAVLRGEGVHEGTDYRGMTVLAAFQPIEGTPWHIVAKTDAVEIMLPLRQRAGLVVNVVLLAICVTGLFVAFLWRSQHAAFAAVQQHSLEEREALVRHFNSLFKQARDIVMLIDPEGRIVETNDAAAAAYGYSAEEFRDLHLRDLRSEETLETLERNFQAADNPEGVQFETVHRRKDGRGFPVEVSARAIEIQGKRYRQSFIRDITERRRQEDEIRRLTRAYATLSQTNEAIVRIADRDELFDRVCRIAVESGGYLGAWIGLVDEAAKALVPVASAGRLDDYVRQLHIVTDPDSPAGRGPSAIALHEGRAYYCDDFLADPATAPWHELARQFGFRSSAALPLKRRNFVVGSLNLYSAEAGAFDSRMRALLEEMAGDVSFALENLDRDKLRRQAEADLRENEQLFRSVVQQNIAAIFVLDGGRFVFANPRACEILGYAPGELDGRDLMPLIAEEDHADVAEMLRAVLAGEVESVERNLTGLCKDGGTVDIGARATRAHLENRPVVLGVAQDIGERKKAQEEIERYTRRLEHAMMATVEAVSAMVELRDPYTSGHERRVGELAAAIGEELGLPAATVTGLRMTGYVHDIGKISVPAEILSKPGRLTELEYEIIKNHARSGYDILKGVEFPWPLPEVILQHHERLDGSGYPQRLKGEAIILEARILAVADVVESMASHRPYRPALGIDKALEEIAQNSGRFYDPQVAEACLRLFREKGYELPK
jgi:PAS domain S-box-containing protein